MFKDARGFPPTNYDALLKGWSTIEGEESITRHVNFDAGDTKYCAGIARTILTNTYSWSILDGGPSDDNCPRDPEAFITTWLTTENDESITIPTTGGGYDYAVDWGDGSDINVGYTGEDNATHIYATPGAYTVTIIGDFPRIYFNGTSGDRNKITSIEQWGTNTWSSMDSAFEGCINLLYNAADNPDLSQVTSMAEMFKDATVFNGNIGDWNVSNVTDMTAMFDGVTLSTEDYDALLEGWSTIEIENDELPLKFDVTFDAGDSQYCAGIARTILESTYNWNIDDGGPSGSCLLRPHAFITTWVTSGENEDISIPTHNQSTYNYSVDWGDNSSNADYTGNATHTYTTAGTYTVTITGDFPRIYFNNNSDDKDKSSP